MIAYKILFGLWWLFFGIPALSYARYLHDDAENVGGAAMVASLFVIAGIGLYFM